MTKKLLLCALAAALAFSSCNCDPEVQSAKALTERLLEGQAKHFKYIHTDDSTDVFSVESRNGRIVISGNNANSMAVGLNWYLKNCCLTTVSWNEADPLWMPEVLPEVPQKVTIEAKAKDRFFLNYCTYGYTMPWWGWKEWEHMIDWMALNGVTMPLNITGQESVLLKVWEHFGIPADKVRESFTGPPFLPWNRMMDIDRWNGPLPQKFIDGQEALQKKILRRERELNMKPVLPAFNGHVPAQLKELYPDATIKEVTKWDGFEPEYGCWFLDPEDPLFGQVQKLFLEEQEKLYGTSHVYGLDIFNEVDFFEGAAGDEWDPQMLARISKHVYETLAAADPQAVWLQVGWMLYFDMKHWTPQNVEAYLGAVPQGGVAMLDYFCDEAEIYKFNRNFYGQPYFFCFLGNFGGNTNLSGNFRELSRRIDAVYSNGGDNLLGLGGTLEGFGVSQWLYEYVLDRGWELGQSDDQWLKTLARRHVGRPDPAIEDAFRMLADDIYVKTTYSGICPIACIHPCLEGNWRWTTLPEVPYTYESIAAVWRKLLESPADTDWYRFDLVNIGSEVLKLCFPAERDAFTQCYYRRDLKGLKEHRDNMRHLYDLWEELLACHSAFSLRDWIEQARSWGDAPQEKDYYEHCARVILTSWGGTGQLTDYANRQWSGLVRNYYRQRWEMFWDEIIADVEGTGPAFDQKAFEKRIRAFELDFGEVNHSLEWQKEGDALEVSRKIAAELGLLPAGAVSIVPQPTTLIASGEPASLAKGRLWLHDKELSQLLEGFCSLALKYGAGQWQSVRNSCDADVLLSLDPSLAEEAYVLETQDGKISLRGGSAHGVWNGLMSLIQIKVQCGETVPGIFLADEPAFAYRGTHLDVCRHFFSVEEVKDYIDILALHKINTFHWHLTEDQGWRIAIDKYPKLEEVGSRRKETLIGPLYAMIGYDGIPYGGCYTKEDAKEIVRYASQRCITVIPEIEMPGHAIAALASYPELGCTGEGYEVWTRWGVSPELFCAGNDKVFEFLEDVLDEICEIFPSEYIHIGGDEARKDRWKVCPKCQARIKAEGLKDEAELQSWFIRKIENYLNSKGRRIIGWDEILEGGVTKTATVMSWRGTQGGIEAARMGNDVIMTPSNYCYLDWYQTADPAGNAEPLAIGGWLPLRQCYSFDPYDQLTLEQRKYIKGVQCNLWTEYIPDYKQIQHQLLPRLAAIAEVAWSEDGRTDYDCFVQRVKTSLLPLYNARNYNYANYAFQNPPLE